MNPSFALWVGTSLARHMRWGHGDEHLPSLGAQLGGWDKEQTCGLCLPRAFCTFPTSAQLGYWHHSLLGHPTSSQRAQTNGW